MKIRLLWILLSSASILYSDIVVQRVIPAKIIFSCGEKGYVDVTLRNTSENSGQGLLRLTEYWNIFEQRSISETAFSLAAGESRTIRLDYQAGSERYGHALRAEVLQNGKSVSAKQEFFNVINEWWRVKMGAHSSPDIDLRKEVADYYGIQTKEHISGLGFLSEYWDAYPEVGPFFDYGNHWTRWGMVRNYVGGNELPDVPDEQIWYAAGGYERTNQRLHQDLENAHKKGVRFSLYTICDMGDSLGFENARRFPQYILRDKRGGFLGRYLNHPADPLQLSLLGKPYKASWNYVNPNFYDRTVLDWALADLIKGIISRKIDSVYFDTTYWAMPGYDYTGVDLDAKYGSEKTSVENILYVNQKLKERFPNLYIWTNGSWDARNFSSAALNHPDNGALLEIQDGFIMNPSFNVHNWRGLFESCLNARNNLWTPDKNSLIKSNILAAGYIFTVNGARDRNDPRFKELHGWWPYCNHIASMLMANALHPYVNGVAFRPMMQFLTRFSEFFWHEDIRILPKGYREFIVDGLRDIWWEDAIFTRKADTYTDYYVHLVNPPEDSTASRYVKEPGIADDIDLIPQMLSGKKRFKAWALRPYAARAAVMEPVVREITPKTVDGEIVLPVPPFKYYTLVLIRVED